MQHTSLCNTTVQSEPDISVVCEVHCSCFALSVLTGPKVHMQAQHVLT